MNMKQTSWKTPVTGVLLLATAVSAEQDLQTYQASTNRVTLSLRFGLNISGKFLGTGNGIFSSAAGGRRTARGDAYNYDDGYVLNDVSGSHDGRTWYWGYDNASQVNASGANSIDLHHDAVVGLPDGNSHDDSPYVGAELTYNYQLGVKADWHQLRYGIEGAINYMPVNFNNNGLYNVTISQRTDTYNYTPGTTPPSSPYQGSFQGPGFVINTPAGSSSTTLLPGGTFLAQQHFNADLWGGRLGPYIECSLTTNLSLHLSGGLAVGLINGSASWGETLTQPGGGSISVSGGGDDTDLLLGYYVSLDAQYQISRHWSIEAGVQFQSLGVYDHDFGGRTVELDLNKSIFVQAGISYSF